MTQVIPTQADRDAEQRAREVLADHAERNNYPLCAASIRKGDDPYFNRVTVEAMLSYAEEVALAARSTALEEAAIPEGYALVPIEPTDAMEEAGQEVCGAAYVGRGAESEIAEPTEVWTAMLGAAPIRALNDTPPQDSSPARTDASGLTELQRLGQEFDRAASTDASGLEDVAWTWLESKWLNVEAGHDPNDRDYSADEMVDAFMAGRASRPTSTSATVLQDRSEIERLKAALQNALYALEYWEREAKVWSDTRVSNAIPAWMPRTRDRGAREIISARAALTNPETK